jgi:hypothetical protein
MLKAIPMIVIILTLSLVTFSATNVRAERATSQEMELVCQNWLSYMVYQKGGWAGQTHPHIVAMDEIVEEETVLARCFSISPSGFVVVPVLKELPPIKAYSEWYRLDVNDEGGFAQLLREVLLDRVILFTRVYGSLDAVQPTTGDVLLGRGHRIEWNRFLKSEEEFENDLIVGKFDPLTEAGPLLTTSWHQYAPYNGLCPTGDVNCIICPSGKPPTFPCKVGCVATATAQILKYWNWPPSGTGSHTYWWYGDDSCDGGTPGAWLSADYSDPYDWAHMPDSCDLGYTPEDSAALAELCYEVGVAFEMYYGVCGSGTWTSMALDVFPTYFRYDPGIDKEDRDQHDAAEWFSIIQEEINNSRPIQYRIRSHSIVCDGWRDTGGLNQYHMNYGWGSSATAWYSIDSLYCYWVLPDSLCPWDEEYLIRNIYPLYDSQPHIVSTSPAQNELNVPVSTNISVTFDVDMDETTINDSTFVVNARSTGLHPGTIMYDGPTKTATFDPIEDFDEGEVVTVVFTTFIESSGGTALDSAYVWSFTSVVYDGSGTFASDSVYAADDDPYSVFSADLDGDGDLDLATANINSSNVSVLLNNGDGTFALQSVYAVGQEPYSVFSADLDGDGDLDLATANGFTDNVSVLLNNGDGTFATQSVYVVGNGPASVFSADLDGDGDMDLTTANLYSGNVSVLLNNGDGTFLAQSVYPVDGVPTSVFSADLDGDGDLDLAIANVGSNNISVLLNNRDGTFTTQFTYAVGNEPWSVFSADLDGDGDMDLTTANYLSDNVSVLLNKGDGTFPTHSVYSAGNRPNSVFSADLDGDGDLDLATANRNSDNVSVLLNNGYGGFATQSVYVVGDYPDGIFSADLDGDGDLDLATANNNSNNVSVLLNEPSFIRGDANGDGVVDPADVVYLINYLFRNGAAPDPLAAGDANCDGVVEPSDVVYLINYLFRGGDPPGCD